MTPEQAAFYNAGLEAARKVIIDGQEVVGLSSNERWLQPRMHGSLTGMAFADAISALTVSSDLVAVPREPTPEMVAEGIYALEGRGIWTWHESTATSYRAMISAWENRG